MALSMVEGPQRGQARTSRPNVRRIKSAKRRASSRGGRRSRSQAGSGAGSVALPSRGSTRTPAVGTSVVRTSLESARSSAVDASAVLASPRLAVFPKPTTSDRHPSTLLGMALSRVEGPQLAQTALPLHENGTSRSSPQSSQRKRAKPPASAKASARLAGALRAKAAGQASAAQELAKFPPPPRLRRGSPERCARRRPARRTGAALPRRADRRPVRGRFRSDRAPPGTPHPATASAAHRSPMAGTRLRVRRIACHIPHAPQTGRRLDPARTADASTRVV